MTDDNHQMKLQLPPLFRTLVESGRWNHPGDEILCREVPLLADPVVFRNWLPIDVMTYPVPWATSATILTGDNAALEALPLIRYAYEHRAAERAHFPPPRGTISPPANLAVDLVSPDDRRVLYRYEVPAGEVTWRLAHPTEK